MEEANKREHIRWIRTRATDAEILMLRQDRDDLRSELAAEMRAREGAEERGRRLEGELAEKTYEAKCWQDSFGEEQHKRVETEDYARKMQRTLEAGDALLADWDAHYPPDFRTEQLRGLLARDTEGGES